MHILVTSGIFHPESGGPATYLYHILPEFQAAGHTVEVITFGDIDEDVTAYPYPVTRIKRDNILKRNWDYYQAVRKRLDDADLLFINSLGLSLPKTDKPKIMKVVGDLAWERSINREWIPPLEDIDDFQNQNYSPLINWLKRSRANEVQNVDQVLVPSNYLRKMVMGWGALDKRISVIYNAFEPFPPPKSKLTRSDLGLPDGRLLLVVARLTAWKGIDVLLEAISEPELADVHLMIAGDGPAMTDFQTVAAELGVLDRVAFLGKVPHRDLIHYYHAADYTVLYSGYEGLSHIILESLSCGTPVIASRKGGNLEIIEDGENGLLVPYRSTLQLKKAIIHAYKDSTYQALHSPPQEMINLERFAWSRMVAETLALLERYA